jgi:hypothetical protein
MAAPTIAPISVALEGFSGTGRIATPALLGAMLRAAEKISDLIFSPGRPPQVQVYGQMIPVQIPGLTFLRPARPGSLPRQHFYSARQLRRRDARHSHGYS